MGRAEREAVEQTQGSRRERKAFSQRTQRKQVKCKSRAINGAAFLHQLQNIFIKCIVCFAKAVIIAA